ncbi:MAG: hypothetical protein IKL89_02655 [Clostridia bacterium]|nr:hypothetical protein [Clostridia bacterium]
MTSIALLREEFRAPRGKFTPSYYRYLGLRDHLHTPQPILRAYGIEALFSRSGAHIHRQDLIVGCTRGASYAGPAEAVEHAKRFVASLGRREFWTNDSHFAPDYEYILTRGLPGLFADIEASRARHAADPRRLEMLTGMQIALGGFRRLISNYAAAAEGLIGLEDYDEERLSFISANCRALLNAAPATFAEGLQLVWLCHTAFMLEERGAMALGRMDQYLYPLYAADIAAGRLDDKRAVELLSNTFTKIPSSDVVNICIGGMDRDKKCRINGLSRCILRAVRACMSPGPNLSLRYTPDLPEDFFRECLESIGTGLGYPALMNDEINIAALSRMGYAEEDVYNYCMVGCIENFLPGQQPPWSDGRFDAPRFIDYVLNEGISAYNRSMGITRRPCEEIASMEEFMNLLCAELSQGAAEYCATFNAKCGGISQEALPEPFLSCFCKECIERGQDINNGGTKYPSAHGAVLMGVATMADSLAAIEKVVFGDRIATLPELRDALAANFEGYDALYAALLAAPKYGNNDDFADKYAVWFLDFLASEFDRYRTPDGGRFYVAMAANVQNIYAGQRIGATPDGRKVGEPLSDAASPTYGRDVRGATATLLSVSKPDYTKAACGTVINQKYSPSLFRGENLSKLSALVRTYFARGGQEIQMNATSRETLIDAMEHPEKYPTLVVRVSGFSEYYVRLAKEVQLDILSRTQHE